MGKKNVKFTMVDIYEFCTKYNIEFCDNIYINNNHPHNWFCNIHKERHSRALDKIRSRGGLKCCCTERKIIKNKKEIKKIEIEQNLCLLSKYQASHIPLMWKCNKHDEIFRKSLQVIRKSPLPECCKREEKLKLIEKIIEPLGYELLDDEYSGKTHTWHCKRHNKTYHNKWTTYLNFEKGQLLKCCSAEKNSGKNHPNYNHDVSDEQRVNDRRSQKNKTWRQSVIRRDNLICQSCGERNIKIVAHHLENYLENSSLRYDLDNGITLCVPCHKEFHSKYGRGSTTKKQTEEWIMNQSQSPPVSQSELPES